MSKIGELELVLTYHLSRDPEGYQTDILKAIVAKELAGRDIESGGIVPVSSADAAGRAMEEGVTGRERGNSSTGRGGMTWRATPNS